MFGRFLTQVVTLGLLAVLVGQTAYSANIKPSNSSAALNIQREAAFSERIRWVGDVEPPNHESEQIWSIIKEVEKTGREEGIQLLDEFIAVHPNSAWTPSLRANVAEYYRYHGGYSRALSHWSKAWYSLQRFNIENDIVIKAQILSSWTSALTRLGRVDEITELINGNMGDTLGGGGYYQIYLRAIESTQRMISDPGVAYRCGSFAVANLVEHLGVPEDKVKEIRKLESPETGFSLKQLHDISTDYGLRLKPVALKIQKNGRSLIAPAVIHWKSGHYAALLEIKDDKCLVVDPTFNAPRWLRKDLVVEESSGFFLAPEENITSEWAEMTSATSSQVFGRGWPSGYNDESDGNCEEKNPDIKTINSLFPESAIDPNPAFPIEECQNETPCPPGMPIWNVSQPFTSLKIEDIPVFYTAHDGSDRQFHLSYKQRDSQINTFNFTIGDLWTPDFLSYMADGKAYPSGHNSVYATWELDVMSGGEGGSRYVQVLHPVSPISGASSDYNSSDNEYYRTFPTGGRLNYGYIQNYGFAGKRYYLTESIDKHGSVTTYNYTTTTNSVVHITSIVDEFGSSTTFTYGTGALEDHIIKINCPGGRNAELDYDSNGRLEFITDVEAMASQFVYDSSDFIEEMITPYGTTSFANAADISIVQTGNYVNRAIFVTHPDNSRELFVYRNSSFSIYGPSSDRLLPNMPYEFPANSIPNPGDLTRETDSFSNINSFHWSIKNYNNLNTNFQSSLDFVDLTQEDYALAHVKHWLKTPHASAYEGELSGVKSVEYLPNPDPNPTLSGTAPVEFGQIIWYDYKNQVDPWETGDHIKPKYVIYLLENGEMRFKKYTRRADGRIDYVNESYTDSNGNQASRTYDFIYSSGRIIEIENPNGETLAEWKYEDSNWPHKITTYINARGDVTRYEYDSTTGRLVKRYLDYDISANDNDGLVTIYSYSGDRLTGITDKNATESATLRSQSFTYSGYDLDSYTDYLGYTQDFEFDKLGRLTKVDHPDSSYEAFDYDNKLYLHTYRNRLGDVVTYEYDSMKQLSEIKDAKGNSAFFDFCGCGVLESVTTPLNETTTYLYDSNYNVKKVVFENSEFVTMEYSKDGRFIGYDDGKGAKSYGYNNQGLLTSVENQQGTLLSIKYDALDHPVEVLQPNGVTVANTFNAAGQLLTRTNPDGGEQEWTYNQRGLNTFEFETLSNVFKTTTYLRDELGRVTKTTTANGDVIEYAYDEASSITDLWDGAGNKSTWEYDNEGRVIKVYDATSTLILQYSYDDESRLNWRWSKGKGTTYYTFDKNNNLININYPSGTADIAYGYDVLNRLTNMVDAVGTTAFAYNNRGLLSSENGPWSSDTVSYTYLNGYLDEMHLERPSTSDWVVEYDYDSSTRLDEIISPVGTFSYDYVGATYQIDDLTMPGSKFIDYEYDSVGRLEDTILKTSEYGSIINRHDYEFNLAGWRTKQTFTGGNYTDYDYDDIGQLIESDESGAGDLNEYAYDAAWNLDTKTLNSGTPSNFDVNSNNELTVSPLTSTNIYDDNGNLILDGVNYYAYDAEDQLVYREFAYTASIDLKFVYSYDGLRRLKQKLIHYYVSDSYVATETIRYVYDGKLSIQERDGSNAILATYTRGLDLSGSLSGAGGIGGILARSWSGNNALYHSDALGNVSTLINSSGTVKAQYTYDPFGYTTSQSGAWATANPYRFSSKEIDYKYFDGGDNYYYGYRFYHPVLHRWLNRDPIGVNGGINLYGFVGNNPTTNYDIWGLYVPGGYLGNPAGRVDFVRGNPTFVPNNPLEREQTRDSNIAALAIHPVVGTGMAVLSGDIRGILTDFIFGKLKALTRILRYPTKPPKYPGSDPSKTPDGFEWKGRPGSKPGSKEGNYHNTKTRETLRPDLDHKEPIGPHWDYRDENGIWYRIMPDGKVVPKE